MYQNWLEKVLKIQGKKKKKRVKFDDHDQIETIIT